MYCPGYNEACNEARTGTYWYVPPGAINQVCRIPDANNASGQGPVQPQARSRLRVRCIPRFRRAVSAPSFSGFAASEGSESVRFTVGCTPFQAVARSVRVCLAPPDYHSMGHSQLEASKLLRNHDPQWYLITIDGKLGSRRCIHW